MKPLVIWLTGGHCAGKTTILRSLTTQYGNQPGCVLFSMDTPIGEAKVVKDSALEARAYVKQLLEDSSLKVLVMEGTRVTSQIFMALAEVDQDKNKFEFCVYLVTAKESLILGRIEARRRAAGRKIIENSPTVASGRLAYEGTGLRQARAIANYGNLYPHSVVTAETVEGFVEQPELISKISQQIDSALGTRVSLSRVINLRGTSGSGKSYAVRHLINLLHGQSISNGNGKVLGYELPGSIRIVGSYENECGGCDGIKTQDAICHRVVKFATQARTVIFEGVVVSTIFDRYLELSKDLGGMVWAYLDTPYETCLQRILMRRHARGDFSVMSDFDEDKNPATKSKFDGLIRQQKKALSAGEKVIILDHLRAPGQLLELVTKGTVDGKQI